MSSNKPTFKSAISGLEAPERDKVSCTSIRVPILNLIIEDHPDIDMSKEITIGELNIYREKYISKFLKSEVGELTYLHKNVLKSLSDDKSLVSKVEDGPLLSVFL